MELTSYSRKSKEFEKSLDKTYKKENGIFYTDIELSKKIIEFLSIPINAEIMDPCCGTGSFLVAAEFLGYSSLFGSDIDENAVLFCKKETNLSHILKLDTLSKSGKETLENFSLDRPVDYVIGNPPYAAISKDYIHNVSDYILGQNVKKSGKNLFVAAIYRAFELTKLDGIISLIIPKNFLHVSSYKPLREYIIKEKRICSIIDIGSYFKNVRGEQIILTLENQKIENTIIELYKYINNEFVKTLEIEQNFYENEILLFNNRVDFDIYNKLKSTHKTFNDVCNGYVGRGKSKSEAAIRGRDIQKFSFKHMDVPKEGNKIFIQNIYSAESGIIASFGGNLEAAETVTIFTDSTDSTCRYILGFLHSRLCNYYLMKFCYNNSRLTVHTDAKYLKKLPLVNDDIIKVEQVIKIVTLLEKTDYMCDKWFDMIEFLNKLIYQIYNIDKDEVEYIDAEMKNFQSQRWNNDKRKQKMQQLNWEGMAPKLF